VRSIDTRDAASLLQIVHGGALDVGDEAFPRGVLLDLARVIPSDACVGYQEADVANRFRVVELVEVIGTPPSAKTEGAFQVLVDGRVVKEDFRLTADLDGPRRRVESSRDYLVDEFGEPEPGWMRPGWRRSEPRRDRGHRSAVTWSASPFNLAVHASSARRRASRSAAARSARPSRRAVQAALARS
jgi:hypothetical protein